MGTTGRRTRNCNSNGTEGFVDPMRLKETQRVLAKVSGRIEIRHARVNMFKDSASHTRMHDVAGEHHCAVT